MTDVRHTSKTYILSYEERRTSMTTLAEKVTYDNYGRMAYHPEYHSNHRKPFTEEELEYLCKFYKLDGPLSISLCLGRTEKTVMSKVYMLKRKGLFEYYKNLNKHW
jgi:hypothetical protein